jgi:nucleotide-binding universal stress UspA family protein
LEESVFGSIVVGTDGSGRAEKAVKEAIDLAKSEGARLYIVTAFSESQPIWETIRSSARVDDVDVREVAEKVLARAARKAADDGVEVDYAARQGDPADVILDVAIENDADLIVVGNKGMTGAKRYLLGSVPNKVSHHATCSVMVVRTD